MAASLAKTRRHHCKKMNNRTVGGGVVWTYMVEAARNVCAIRVLKIVEGAWHDTVVMRGVRLVPQGPVYLMDRGFYALDLLSKWLRERVHFIVRARAGKFQYTVERVVSSPRPIGKVQLLVDAWVRLGGAQAKVHPRVRLVMGALALGKDLILVSDLSWSAEEILAAYKKRWHIERFHKLLKDTLGLAHLYSFSQDGISFLLHVALLVCLLLLMVAEWVAGATIEVLDEALRALRTSLGLATPWRRNSCTVSRGRNKKAEAKAEVA